MPEGDAHLSEVALFHARDVELDDAGVLEAHRAVDVAVTEGVDVLATHDTLTCRHGQTHECVYVFGIDIPVGSDELPIQHAHVVIAIDGARVGVIEDEGLPLVFGRRERIDRAFGHIDGVVATRRATRRTP